MKLFDSTYTYGSHYSAEELQSILRFEKIGGGTYFHVLDAENAEGFILKPKMNLPAKNNFAPTVTVSLQEETVTLRFQPPREMWIFIILVLLFCALVFAIGFSDMLRNPWLLLIFPLIFLFLSLFFYLGCRLTYRNCMNKFAKQLKLYPIHKEK